MISEADIKFPDIPFRKTAALILVGLVLYLGYLYLVGFDSLKSALLGTDYRLLLFAAIVSLFGNMFHAAGWWVFLRDMKYKVSFLKAYQIYLSSIFFVNVIPTAAVSGEVAKIYFVQKADPGSRFDRTLAAGLMSRILEIIPVSLGAIVGVLYVAVYYHIPTWALAFCIVIAVALAIAATIILVVAMNNDLLRRLTAWSINVLGKIFKNGSWNERAEHFDRIILQFGGSLREITGKKLLIATALALIFIAWCFDVSVAYLAFLAIGNPVSTGLRDHGVLHHGHPAAIADVPAGRDRVRGHRHDHVVSGHGHTKSGGRRRHDHDTAGDTVVPHLVGSLVTVYLLKNNGNK